MVTQRKVFFWFWNKYVNVALIVLGLGVYGCTQEYPAAVGNKLPPETPATSPASTSACSCSATGTSSTSGTATTVTSGTTKVDTLDVAPPRLSPNGGNFYFSTNVKLSSDALPAQAVYEFSLDNGKSWQTGQEFTVTAGGTVLARLRVGERPSRSRGASFSIYYQRMLVIGNSIMAHGPAPQLGWYTFNGMAASAPEKDFVHLLTARLQTLNPAMTYQLQAGTGLELDFGRPSYKMEEFDQVMQTYKPDLVVVRLGENVADGEVPVRGFEGQFRAFVARLTSLSEGRSVRVVTTTSVWEKPQTDAVIRRVIGEKGWPLVDLQCMVGQSQYAATQFANPGVAQHPNDAGMQKIADLIWEKIQ